MTRVFDDENQPVDEPPEEPTPGPGSSGLGPTTPLQVAVAVLTGGVVGWFIVSTMDSLGQVVPVTPWLMSALMAVGSLFAVLRARRTKVFMDRNPDRAGPLGLMLLVIGKSMVFTGLLLAGGHLVYVLMNVGSWGIPLPRQRVINGSIAVVASLLVAWCGGALERMARVS